MSDTAQRLQSHTGSQRSLRRCGHTSTIGIEAPCLQPQPTREKAETSVLRPPRRANSIRTQDPCYTDPVANLTLAIDDETLRFARIRALEQGTSVNAIVREYLRSYVGNGARQSLQAFLARAERSQASSGSGGRTWTREELYDLRA